MSSSSSQYPTLILLLSVVGLVLSIFSLYSFTEIRYGDAKGESFCNISEAFNCDAVNQSAFSTVLGVPLASYGVAFYLTFIIFALLSVCASSISKRFFSSTSLVITTLASIYSIYLFLISEFIIGTLCILCIGMYLVNLAMLGTSLWENWSKGILRELVDGGIAVVATPFSAIGLKIGAQDNRIHAPAAQILVLSAFLAIILSIRLPDFLVNNFIGRSTNFNTLNDEFHKIITDWKRSPLINFGARDGGLTEQDFVKGAPDAKVEIVEFVDFQCPACRRFFNISDEIVSEYAAQVKIVFKNYPLDGLCNKGMPPSGGHPFACKLAYFARCAGEQDKFWEATRFLMNLESLSGHPQSDILLQDLDRAMQLLGLDKEAMKECVQSERIKQKIEKDISDGNAVGVDGTPAVWINNRRITVLTADALRAIINSIINK